MSSAKFRDEPLFPLPTFRQGRGYISRRMLEWYKGALRAHSLGLALPPPPEPQPGDVEIPLPTAAEELGVCRRTIGRYVRRAQQTAAPGLLDPVDEIRKLCAGQPNGAQLNRIKRLAGQIGRHEPERGS
jgi:hypothetical protein